MLIDHTASEIECPIRLAPTTMPRSNSDNSRRLDIILLAVVLPDSPFCEVSFWKSTWKHLPVMTKGNKGCSTASGSNVDILKSLVSQQQEVLDSWSTTISEQQEKLNIFLKLAQDSNSAIGVVTSMLGGMMDILKTQNGFLQDIFKEVKNLKTTVVCVNADTQTDIELSNEVQDSEPISDTCSTPAIVQPAEVEGVDTKDSDSSHELDSGPTEKVFASNDARDDLGIAQDAFSDCHVARHVFKKKSSSKSSGKPYSRTDVTVSQPQQFIKADLVIRGLPPSTDIAAISGALKEKGINPAGIHRIIGKKTGKPLKPVFIRTMEMVSEIPKIHQIDGYNVTMEFFKDTPNKISRKLESGHYPQGKQGFHLLRSLIPILLEGAAHALGNPGAYRQY